MEKPFDLKALGERLKAKGLDIGEEALKMACEEVFAWGEESADLSPNPIVKLVVGLVKPAKPYVMAQIDKIDGQQG